MAPRSWSSGLTGYFVYILLVATLGPLLFGFHLMNPTQWGVVGSMFTLGGLVGALSSGIMASRYGRLRTMQMTTVFFAIGPVFEALSLNMGVMAFGRLLSGVGAGASVVIVPLYISEIAPPAQKGFFGAFTQIMCNVGILITQLLGYFLSHDSYWRVVLAIGGVVGIAQALGLLLSVESPKYTAEQGNVTLARRTLRKIRGEEANIDDEVSGWGDAGSEHVNAEEQALLNNQGRPSQQTRKPAGKEETLSIMQVFRHPDYKSAAMAVIMVMLAQQFSGINSIVMYGVSLLAGLLESNSALLNLAVSALNIIVTAGCAPLSDKLGRKTCLLSSIAGMGVSSLLLAVSIIKAMPALSAVAVLLFVSSFGLGLGPVPFILASELVGPDAVDATQSIALGANWIATFIVAQFFPLASAKLHGKVYFIFAALSAFFFAFISWYVPETKGKKNADEHADGFDFPASGQDAEPDALHRVVSHEPPPSMISPAFTPPATPGTSTPSHPRPPRSVPVDTSMAAASPRPELLQKLPEVECEVRARIPTTTGHEMWLHVYRNSVDTKEHLAIVFGSGIRSRSLDAERPGETELDRMTRGAYVGRLYPGRTSSRIEQIKRAEGVATKRKPAEHADASNGLLSPSSASSEDGDAQYISASDLPLVRIHSECYTGETVWSARCDCGEQLDEAARLMADPTLSPSGGAVIYLRQEGRGIGLGEKLKAYNLQDLGNDTYEANIMLRHPADARSYGLATAMLMDLGLDGERGIRLLTNNPDKVHAVEGPRREVVVRERVAMVPIAWKTGGEKGINSEEVEKYLSTKIEKFKHMLDQK
ncbi:hypothetical protein P153DRAFT_377920 [Dothidotthia symphoricarpi CBS 119687]|uniref:Major facilitator superfamily (MFS) profile domain-containing protein n=1 Tax=Dothidotthia symphoricarpi CBS 119687 TaxID=1392245 RepID=A0A6A6A796_9PLEO|nr:uncharacterized protein P153DRAFT_377920 [Dothidotthia symphoricarpi CBS 119687]KAF2127013.1 hypothetical protein P153DRAFT_377920 [Dothidotthia symphoricarpi CBS 119687]